MDAVSIAVCSRFLTFGRGLRLPLASAMASALHADGDPSRFVREVQVAPCSAEVFAADGLMGAGFVEQRLTAVLGASGTS